MKRKSRHDRMFDSNYFENVLEKVQINYNIMFEAWIIDCICSNQINFIPLEEMKRNYTICQWPQHDPSKPHDLTLQRNSDNKQIGPSFESWKESKNAPHAQTESR